VLKFKLTADRSDVLGHIMPVMGRDWSHEGIAELYTNIAANGYQVLYLTARAIGQVSR
jgi:phosphatidate phosphatase LPIN